MGRERARRGGTQHGFSVPHPWRSICFVHRAGENASPHLRAPHRIPPPPPPRSSVAFTQRQGERCCSGPQKGWALPERPSPDDFSAVGPGSRFFLLFPRGGFFLPAVSETFTAEGTRSEPTLERYLRWDRFRSLPPCTYPQVPTSEAEAGN